MIAVYSTAVILGLFAAKYFPQKSVEDMKIEKTAENIKTEKLEEFFISANCYKRKDKNGRYNIGCYKNSCSMTPEEMYIDEKSIHNCAERIPDDLRGEEFFDQNNVECSETISNNPTLPKNFRNLISVCYHTYHTESKLLDEEQSIYIERCYDFNGRDYNLVSIEKRIKRCYDYDKKLSNYKSAEIHETFQDLRHPQEIYEDISTLKTYKSLSVECNGG